MKTSIAMTILLLLFCTPALSEEVDCLARMVYAEARGEPLEGQYAVAYVALNRTEDERFPNTVCGVIHQPGQFTWARDPSGQSWTRARQVARAAMELHDSDIDNTNGAVYFNVGARQTYHGMLTRRIGNHNFYQ